MLMYIYDNNYNSLSTFCKRIKYFSIFAIINTLHYNYWHIVNYITIIPKKINFMEGVLSIVRFRIK